MGKGPSHPKRPRFFAPESNKDKPPVSLPVGTFLPGGHLAKAPPSPAPTPAPSTWGYSTRLRQSFDSLPHDPEPARPLEVPVFRRQLASLAERLAERHGRYSTGLLFLLDVIPRPHCRPSPA